MTRLRQFGLAVALLSVTCACYAQGTNGGVLYASDFAKWGLPTGNTPARGTILWPNQEICKVSPAGYNFVGPKVGRQVKIVDANPALTETITPSAVSLGNSGCMLSGTMSNTHSTYSVQSATAGLQEAIDYQAGAAQGSIVILTPAWTAAGGTSGMITAASGNANVTILDERQSVFVPYVWSGSAYIAQPFSGGNIVAGSGYALPSYASGLGSIVSPSNVTVDVTGNNLTVPGTSTTGTLNATTVGATTVNASNVVSTVGVTAPAVTLTGCTAGTFVKADGTGCSSAGASGVSGQAANVIGLGGSPTTITAQSHINEATAGTTTVTQNLSVPNNAITAKTGFGFPYVAQFQTGGGNNGIANCFLTQTVCVADPTYGNTEAAFTSGGPLVPAPTNAFFLDYRNGSMGGGLIHNPGTSAWASAYRLPWNQVMVNDTTQSAPGGTGNITAPLYSMAQWLYYQAPGIDLGNTAFGPSGWDTQVAHSINLTANSPGISEIVSATLTKAGIGDNVGPSFTTINYGGAIASSDEGNHALRLIGGNAATQLNGTIATGSTGSTSVTINCTQDCTNPGDGRFLVLTQTPLSSGNITAVTNPSGNTPGNFTIDQTVTASTAWATLNGNCIPTTGTGNARWQGTSTVCNVTMLSGTFAVNDYICFSGTFDETAQVTAATGSSFTAVLRHQHGSGSWVMANGPCSSVLNLTANSPVVNAVTLHFPFKIIGATTTSTLQYTWFRQGSSTGAIPNFADFLLTTFSGSSITNVGGIVTMNLAGSTILNNPQLYGGISITISGASVSAYNGACTNTFLVPGANTFTLGCFQSSSNGAASGATGTISYTASGSYTQWGAAEVLDVQTYTSTPATACPSNVCTFTLEANNVAWSPGSTVEEPQHYAYSGNHVQDVQQFYNPMRQAAAGWSIGLFGAGICCGQASSASSYAQFLVGNNQAVSTYQYHGGLVTPPGGFRFNGLWDFLYAMQFAPDPPGSSAEYIGCPQTGCTDTGFYYNWVTLVGNGSSGTAQYFPYGNELVWGANMLFTNPLPKTTFKDNIVGSTLATPAAPTTVAKVAGGTVAGGAASRCYTVVALNTPGLTPQSTEHCQAIPAALTLTSVADASGGKTVYTGTITGGGSNALAGGSFLVAGFVNGGNNGTFVAVASTTTTLTLVNAGGIAETTSATATGQSYSVVVTWARIQGATSYKICEGATGSELLAYSSPGSSPDLITWTDTGVTSSGACSTTNTTQPALDSWAYAGIENTNGTTETKIGPSANASTTFNEALPLTGTAGQLIDMVISAASVSGDVATFSNTTQRIQDSGTLLTSLAPKASPALTGAPTAPTQAAGDTSTDIATDAFVYASTSKVNTCGTTTTCSNTAQASPRIVWGTVTLSSGTATVGSMAAWTSTTSFVCTPNDTTTAGAAKITNTSTSSITVTGGTSDVVNYICVGN